MNKQHIHRGKLPFFSSVANDLAYCQDQLAEFIGMSFSEEAFEKQLALKKANYTTEKRVVLQKALLSQYAGIQDSNTKNQIELISKENTFTITTGHQLNLMTGPLYFMYKIAHAIKLAQNLAEKHPEFNFVPVYWMATEDHDLAEINHFQLFGNKITWETEQTGPVGRFELENWSIWKEELTNLLNDDDQIVLNELFSFYDGKNLAEATRRLVHHLFGKYGLLIIDGDDKNLKALFSSTAKKEINEHFAEKQVLSTNEKLEKAGYNAQVYVRPINLFYIEKGIRSRLVPEENGKITIEGKGNFSKEELIELLENQPDSFSPNALLRPVYQETILPNLAYVGGGGELAYWLQIKSVFEALNLTYPLLAIRNSIQYIDQGTRSKMEKMNLQFTDFLKDVETMKKEFVLNNNEKTLDFNDVESVLDTLEATLKQKATEVDASLVGSVAGEMARIKKSMEGIRGKLIKAEKMKFEQELKRLEQIMQKLFPAGQLQERYDNFLSMYLRKGTTWIDELIAACEPFNADFLVLES